MDQSPSPPPPPIAPIEGTAINCIGCGYNLSGTAIGGACPECGTPVQRSLRPRTQAGATSSRAVTCLVLGIVSLAVCALAGPFAIGTYSRVRRDYDAGLETESSLTMAKIGNVLGIIATVLLVIMSCVVGVAILSDL
jgi:hypothetical protein